MTYIDLINDGYIGNSAEILSFWTKRGAAKALKQLVYRATYLSTSYGFVTWHGKEDWFGGAELYTKYNVKVAKLPKMAHHPFGKRYYLAVITLKQGADHEPTIPTH